MFSRLTPVMACALLTACSSDSSTSSSSSNTVVPNSSNTRPAMLTTLLADGPLKTRLSSCDLDGVSASEMSISHRGAPFKFPEHTREGYLAAIDQGAGIVECDVTFTKDKELVCRHSQCDLHTTTNILDTELAQACSTPPDVNSATPFLQVQCCTSDITLAEFLTLKGKRDGSDKNAATLNDFYQGTPGWSEDVQANYGEVLSHKQSIELFNAMNVGMTPELKVPQVPMPFEGQYTQEMYAAQMIDDYINAGIAPSRVYPQSFDIADLQFWLRTVPEFGAQAIYLDGRYRNASFDVEDANSWSPSMAELAADGVEFLASPVWMLLSLDNNDSIVPSQYSKAATAAGLKLIAWTIERSGPIASGDNWYYQNIQAAIKSEGDVLIVLDVLFKQVGVVGVFSDWPATTSFYLHCS